MASTDEAEPKPELPGVDDCLIIEKSEVTVVKKLPDKDAKQSSAQWNVAVRYDKSLNNREIALLKGMNHNNIVRFFGVIRPDRSSEMYGYVEELCDRGTLFKYIHSDIATHPLELPLAIEFSIGIASGVRYLHEDAPDAPIKHKNLRSCEVLLKTKVVKGELKLIPKISGFDFAKQHNTAQATVLAPIPEPWRSPERIEEKASTPESDIYSMGIIMSEMLSREEPLKDMKGFQAMMFVSKGGRPKIIAKPEFKDMNGLIDKCWAQEPNDRPTAGEVERQLEEMTQDGTNVPTPVPVPVKVPTAPASAPLQGFTVMADDEIDKKDSEKISDGSIGYAKTARLEIHGEVTEVVLKGLRRRYKDNFETYCHDTLSQIETHENIVTVFGRTSKYIVMEKMPTSLEKHLTQSITDKSEFLKIALGVASGLEHLHNLEPPMVHGRIHPRNVFLDSDMSAKISDAGYFYMDHEAGLSPTDGMEVYQADEAKKSHSAYYHYGGPDIFSFGVLLIEMYTLKKLPPDTKKQSEDRKKVLEEVKNGWPELHELVAKYTEPGQNGMLNRKKLKMGTIIQELTNLRKKQLLKK